MTSFETFMSSCTDAERIRNLAVADQFANMLKLFTTRLMRSEYRTNYLQDGNLIVMLPRANLNLRLLPPVKIKANKAYKYAGDMRVSHVGDNIVDWLSYSPLKYDGGSAADYCPATPDHAYLARQISGHFKNGGVFEILSLPVLARLLYEHCVECNINISTALPYYKYGISINPRQLSVTTDKCLVSYVFMTPENCKP